MPKNELYIYTGADMWYYTFKYYVNGLFTGVGLVLFLSSLWKITY